MAQSVKFLPLARRDLLEARDWYDARAPGLGDAFIAEVDRQVARIKESPDGFPIMVADVRRARLRRFPYALFYRIAMDHCFVIACFHASRDPKRWRERV